MTLIDEYLELQQKYEQKYGEKTIVLMQVGGFFEIYGVVNSTENIGKINEISEITGLTVSKKNDKFSDVSRKNPFMAGFPTFAFEKWREILIKHGWTIIRIDQEGTAKSAEITRNITEIISPGINLDADTPTNFIMSCFLEQMKDFKTKLPILALGISLIDVSTGETLVYETNSPPDDYRLVYDEVYRFLKSYRPMEIIVHTTNISIDKEKFTQLMEYNGHGLQWNNFSDPKFDYLLTPKYRNDIIKRIFPKTGMLSPIEYIGMEKSHFALNSFIYLLEFIWEHNETVIQKLYLPKFLDCQQHLILSYDCVNGLNILPDKNHLTRNRINSLFSIIDKTTSNLGRRFLLHNLLNPIINIDELNKRYDIIQKFIELNSTSNFIEELRNNLMIISDLERLHRRMAIKTMNPCSFLNLDISYKSIQKIISHLSSIPDFYILHDIIPDPDTILSFNQFIDDYHSKIDMDKINGISIDNIKESIFKPGFNNDIDLLQYDLENSYLYLSLLSSELWTLSGSKETENQIQIKENEKDGIYLSISPSKGKIIKENFNKKSDIKINIGDAEYIIKPDELEWKTNTTNTKITSKAIDILSYRIMAKRDQLVKLSLDVLKNLLGDYYDTYHITFDKIINFISFIDFLQSGAKCALEYHYCRPIIELRENSFLNVKELRHPIIERLSLKTEYIPNEAFFDETQRGMLLYGINSSGKSSTMKSVGLAIVMAQMGYFVPASEFIFNPYRKLFTRIGGYDNLFKGQSTFAMEMSELRSILLRADEFSLVLGDELCSGTETISGISIVSAGVMRLSSKNTSFLFATHLHQLVDLDEIKELPNVKAYHLETVYDEAKKILIYNRKLKPGSGSAIYGLEVAKAMELDKEFIETALKIRKKIMDLDDRIINKKESIYNSEVIINKCDICGDITDEIHHIKHQKDADKFGYIGKYHKNSISNLSQLCHKCHMKVHHGDLVINGWKQTTDGPILEYETKEPEKKIIKLKYSEDIINKIKKYYETSKTYSFVVKKLLLEDNIVISASTVKKYVSL